MQEKLLRSRERCPEQECPDGHCGRCPRRGAEWARHCPGFLAWICHGSGHDVVFPSSFCHTLVAPLTCVSCYSRSSSQMCAGFLCITWNPKPV